MQGCYVIACIVSLHVVDGVVLGFGAEVVVG